MAIASSRQERTLPREAVFIGEVGLTGEVRPVSRLADRMREAARLGFRSLVVSDGAHREPVPPSLELVRVRDVRQALAAFEVA
jgi:DNA repair protein RadA/Sms